MFFVPANARWFYLQSRAKLPEIGKDVDSAMEAIEKENTTLKGVLPKQYARQNLDKASLGALIDMIATIALGNAKAQAQDVPGRVYEYFLGEFAAAEGKKGGKFYTPGSIVKVLVNMLEPYKGRVYDPCCGAKAAIPGINSSDVKNLDSLFIDDEVLKKFDEVIEPLFSKLLHNSREMAVLGHMRDTLLPKLMSGGLRGTELQSEQR